MIIAQNRMLVNLFKSLGSRCKIGGCAGKVITSLDISFVKF